MSKERSRIQENLLNLYLRLNGFFVTGFIIHSAEYGCIRSEIDALGIRLPFNDEPERAVAPSPYLDTSSVYTDLLICEVKSRGQSLQFNPALYDSRQSIESVLRWSGLFRHDEIDSLAPLIQDRMRPNATTNLGIPTVLGPRDTRIRMILVSPGRWKKHSNQVWFIYGQEFFDYLWSCFCPNEPRSLCSVVYDFEAWGENFTKIVKYFKDRKKNGNDAGTLMDLYKYFNV